MKICLTKHCTTIFQKRAFEKSVSAGVLQERGNINYHQRKEVQMEFKKNNKFEAKLYVESEKGFFKFPRAKGELEYRRWASGEETFRIKLKKLELPAKEGTVSVCVNDKEVAQVAVTDSPVSVTLSTEEGHEVPTVTLNDRACVIYNGDIQCEGTFHID